MSWTDCQTVLDVFDLGSYSISAQVDSHSQYSKSGQFFYNLSSDLLVVRHFTLHVQLFFFFVHLRAHLFTLLHTYMSSLSESAPTSSRPQTPSSGLDDEERRRDIEQAMMSSPTQSDDGQDIEGTTVPGLDEHNGNWTGAGEPSSLVYRNDYAAARRLISQAKANPYQRQEAEAFCKVSQPIFVEQR